MMSLKLKIMSFVYNSDLLTFIYINQYSLELSKIQLSKNELLSGFGYCYYMNLFTCKNSEQIRPC